MAGRAYSYKKLDPSQEELELHQFPSKSPNPSTGQQLGPEELLYQTSFLRRLGRTKAIALIMSALLLILAIAGVVRSAVLEPRDTSSASTTHVPQYFQTTPELFAGKFTSSDQRKNHS